MSYVAINVLTVPKERASTLEERFAARQGAVDSAPGFEHFELLRPVEGTQDYLVYTRWRSEADFVSWRDGQRFIDGHAASTARPAGAEPAASGSSIWAFEVAQTSSAGADRPTAER
jgi:heme-degrading monooxygenase HmoA